ncbi:metalloregulator ArsR/SmtB family transcription factor, partial [Nonomuraea sp. NPDC055795]
YVDMSEGLAERCNLLCLDLPLAEEIRSSLPELGVAERAAGLARALADPTRLRIAVALAAAPELCVCDLAWVSGLAQNLVSHHLRVLRQADLVTARRDGRLVMYALTGGGRTVLQAVLPQALPTAGAVRALAQEVAR